MKEEFTITLADLFRACVNAKKKIILGAIGFSCLTLLYLLQKPVEYQVEGSFLEKTNLDSGLSTSSVAAMIFSGAKDSKDSEAISLMKSRKVLDVVVQKLALQATIKQQGLNFPRLRNIKENLIAEYASLTNSTNRILEDPPPVLRIRDLDYQGDNTISLKVTFLSENDYEVFYSDDKLGEGTLSIPFYIPGVSFTLYTQEQAPLLSETFFITLHPLPIITKRISKRVDFASDLRDSKLIKIQFLNPDRYAASQFVNELMYAYQDHLRDEQQRISSEQISYLESREEEMAAHLEKLMEAYGEKVTADLTHVGFASTQTAMEFLTKQLLVLQEKASSIELQLKRLEKAKEGVLVYDTSYQIDESTAGIQTSLTEMRQLKHQKDTIEQALRHFPDRKQHTKDFQGMNLQTANELYVKYSTALSQVESDISERKFIMSQLKEPGFEISSLSSVLKDPISNKMIDVAGQIVLQLNDDRNRSELEKERLRRELGIQEKFLNRHLSQNLQLLELNQYLLKEKIYSIQSATLDLIHQQIATYDRQLAEFIDTRINNLHQERLLVAQHRDETRAEMAKLPKRWVADNLIQLHLKMNEKMVEEITKLAESKNISKNLESVQSAPIDLAFPPIHPKSPKLMLWGLLSAFLGAFAAASWAVGSTIYRGIPVSKENLELAKLHVAGSWTGNETDLSVLRRLITQFSKEKSYEGRSILILQGKGPDCSRNLGELLKKQGGKVLILSLDFNDASISESGLIQYIENKVPFPTIQNEEYYDTISSGGHSSHGPELIQSALFDKLLFQLSEKYDWIIASSSIGPDAPEAEAMIRLFDCAVANVHDEKLKDLSPLIDQAIALPPKTIVSFVFC